MLGSQLADYVMKEFPSLTKQHTSFTCFPSQLGEILDASNKGDKAELDVYNQLRQVKIPGLSIIVFNGRCYAGKVKGSKTKQSNDGKNKKEEKQNRRKQVAENFNETKNTKDVDKKKVTTQYQEKLTLQFFSNTKKHLA